MTLSDKLKTALDETRILILGAQALFGFQLAIVLTRAFEQPPKTSMVVHAASLVLFAFAIVMLMALAPYHRIVCAGEDTEDMYRVGSALVIGATLPLGLETAGDVYVVIAKISGSSTIGSVTGGSALVLLTVLWYIYPIIRSLWRDAAGSLLLASAEHGQHVISNGFRR